ncbi:hypothetical protein HN51_057184 [Arachis hypogaea]
MLEIISPLVVVRLQISLPSLNTIHWESLMLLQFCPALSFTHSHSGSLAFFICITRTTMVEFLYFHSPAISPSSFAQNALICELTKLGNFGCLPLQFRLQKYCDLILMKY